MSATVLTTGFFVVVEAAALIWGGIAMQIFIFVSLVMFTTGCVAFLAAFVIGVGRSRYESIAVSTIYGLAGTPTRGVRVRLFGALAIEVIAAVVGAALRPFTPMAFGVLAPMFAVGMTGLWGARYGGVLTAAPDRPIDEDAPETTTNRASDQNSQS